MSPSSYSHLRSLPPAAPGRISTTLPLNQPCPLKRFSKEYPTAVMGTPLPSMMGPDPSPFLTASGAEAETDDSGDAGAGTSAINSISSVTGSEMSPVSTIVPATCAGAGPRAEDAGNQGARASANISVASGMTPGEVPFVDLSSVSALVSAGSGVRAEDAGAGAGASANISVSPAMMPGGVLFAALTFMAASGAEAGTDDGGGTGAGASANNSVSSMMTGALVLLLLLRLTGLACGLGSFFVFFAEGSVSLAIRLEIVPRRYSLPSSGVIFARCLISSDVILARYWRYFWPFSGVIFSRYPISTISRKDAGRTSSLGGAIALSGGELPVVVWPTRE
mmetsp:Transcript_5338/g.12758  ORF Transcript_5338/g.12758 Transcript_5338/m.12758 type:complete len:336 (-) Transcript_5338:1264-2271(-)